jgi:hypothetical protein
LARLQQSNVWNYIVLLQRTESVYFESFKIRNLQRIDNQEAQALMDVNLEIIALLGF